MGLMTMTSTPSGKLLKNIDSLMKKIPKNRHRNRSRHKTDNPHKRSPMRKNT